MSKQNLLHTFLLNSALLLSLDIITMDQKAYAGKASASIFAEFNLMFDINGECDDVSNIFHNIQIDGSGHAKVNEIMDETSIFIRQCPNLIPDDTTEVISDFGIARENPGGECNGALILNNIARAVSEPSIPGIPIFADAVGNFGFSGDIIKPKQNSVLSINGKFEPDDGSPNAFFVKTIPVVVKD